MSELVADMATPDPPRSTNETQQSTGTFFNIAKNLRNRVDLALRVFSSSNHRREQYNQQRYEQTRNEYKKECGNNRDGRGNSMPIIYYTDVNGSNNVTVTNNFTNNINPPIKQKHKVHMNKKQKRRIDLYIRQLAGVQSQLTKEDKFEIKSFVKNWEKAAKELGFEDSVIDQHSTDCRAEKVAEIFYKLIISWERCKGRDATVGKLAEALWFSHEYDAIEKLAKNYGFGSAAE